jgi:hypothetical protein
LVFQRILKHRQAQFKDSRLTVNQDAGVVDQHIQSSEGVLYFADGGLNGSLIGHIDWQIMTFQLLGAEPVPGIETALLIPCTQQ